MGEHDGIGHEMNRGFGLDPALEIDSDPLIDAARAMVDAEAERARKRLRPEPEPPEDDEPPHGHRQGHGS